MLTVPKVSAVRFVSHGDVSVIALSGVLTPAALNDVRHELKNAWGERSPSVIVADLRGAVLTMAAPAMTAATLATPDFRDTPVAMVALGHTADALRDHAFLCAQQGVLRVVSPDVPRDLEWARAQVDLLRYFADLG